MYDQKRDEETRVLKEFYLNMKSGIDFKNIETFCRQTGTNYTSLNRAFGKILGISTKKFERLIKFRKTLDYLVNNPVKLSTVGIDSGYFDQSHFINEFKHYMNMSPSKYLSLLNKIEEHNIIRKIEFTLI